MRSIWRVMGLYGVDRLTDVSSPAASHRSRPFFASLEVKPGRASRTHLLGRDLHLQPQLSPTLLFTPQPLHPSPSRRQTRFCEIPSVLNSGKPITLEIIASARLSPLAAICHAHH